MLAINYTYAEIQTLIDALHFTEDQSCNLVFISECKKLREKIHEANNKRTKKAKSLWDKEGGEYLLSIKKKANIVKNNRAVDMVRR